MSLASSGEPVRLVRNRRRGPCCCRETLARASAHTAEFEVRGRSLTDVACWSGPPRRVIVAMFTCMSVSQLPMRGVIGVENLSHLVESRVWRRERQDSMSSRLYVVRSREIAYRSTTSSSPTFAISFASNDRCTTVTTAIASDRSPRRPGKSDPDEPSDVCVPDPWRVDQSRLIGSAGLQRMARDGVDFRAVRTCMNNPVAPKKGTVYDVP